MNFRTVKKRMEKEEEDRRREEAIASTPCLRPNFSSTALSSQQLSKFRELHKRRLQIKSKNKTKGKDDTKTSKVNNFSIQDSEVSHVESKESSLLNCEGFDNKKEFSLEQDNASMGTSKKRQKLHWGLDTKERWERKSNM